MGNYKPCVSLSDILGNAYLSLYFNTGQNPKISQQALSAYAQAVSIHGHPGHTNRCSSRNKSIIKSSCGSLASRMGSVCWHPMCLVLQRCVCRSNISSYNLSITNHLQCGASVLDSFLELSRFLIRHI